MKAIQITEAFRTALTDLPKPEAEAGKVLLKIHYVGFCGSDLKTFLGENGMVTFPRIPGHEVAAEVISVGTDVPEGILSHGDTVTVNPYTSCGKCPSCRRRRYNACQYNETLGVQRDGAMTEYLSIPWEKVIPCRDIALQNAALIEPMSVGFHAVSRGRVTDSDTVMVIGCGMVGLGAVAGAVLRGATVIAADIDDEKLTLARELGAQYTYNTTASSEGIPEPDVVIEAVGSVPTYRMAVEKVAFTGRMVCIGYAKSEVSLPTGLFVKKELDIMGSRNAEPEDFEAVIRYVRTHDVSRFISGIIKPRDVQKALTEWAAAPGRIFRILVDFE